MVGLAAYKTPLLSILQIGGYRTGLTASLMASLATDVPGTLRASTYLLAETSSEVVRTAQAEYGGVMPGFRATVLDRVAALTAQGLEDENFNLVVIAREFESEAHSMRPSCKPNRYCVLVEDL